MEELAAEVIALDVGLALQRRLAPELGPDALGRAIVRLVLLLGGRLDIRAVAGALLIGAGAGVSWLWRPRCWPPRRSSV